MKNQKGITLIALVITIIVLLILAGITIAMLTGDNGLLTKSQQAANDNAIGGAKDIVSIPKDNNPIILSDYSDPDAIRVGDSYYMVASSFNHTPGVPVLKSKNLVDWKKMPGK